MKDLHERAIEAAKRYVSLQGCDIVESGGELFDLVFYDNAEDCLCLCEVDIKSQGHGLRNMDEIKPRAEIERMAAEWFANSEQQNTCAVRFDTLDMVVVSADRAFLRHTKNAYGLFWMDK